MKTFDNCVIKRVKGGWGVFTPEPANQKDYIWFITRNRRNDNRSFVCIPTWVNDKEGEIERNILSKPEALKLAEDYDTFYRNSEW